MASKGQKFRKYDVDFKRKVLTEYLNGKSARTLGEQYRISRKTIETWMRKYRKDGTLQPTKRQGRPRGKQNYKEKYEILKKFQAFLEEVDQEKR